MTEDLGKVIRYFGIGLKPLIGNTIQVGSVIIHDFETGIFEQLIDHNLVFSHTE